MRTKKVSGGRNEVMSTDTQHDAQQIFYEKIELAIKEGDVSILSGCMDMTERFEVGDFVHESCVPEDVYIWLVQYDMNTFGSAFYEMSDGLFYPFGSKVHQFINSNIDLVDDGTLLEALRNHDHGYYIGMGDECGKYHQWLRTIVKSRNLTPYQ